MIDRRRGRIRWYSWPRSRVFITGIVTDFATKSVEKNSVKRAIQLREIVTSLGPAYIKLGQALSIRPDILTPAAMTSCRNCATRCRVSITNWRSQRSRLSSGANGRMCTRSSDRIRAAASLGQVYKGVLKENGEVVAVKVQRPRKGNGLDRPVRAAKGGRVSQAVSRHHDGRRRRSTSGRRVSSKSSITTWRGKPNKVCREHRRGLATGGCS